MRLRLTTPRLPGVSKWRRLGASTVRAQGGAHGGPTGVKRKLAVVLAADVEGYSRLMGADEEATLKTLGAHREASVPL